MPAKPIEPRFLKFTDKTPGHGPQGECWIWTGVRFGRGYGRLCVNSRYEPAHRVSYTLYCGPIPEGQVVRHACDNPSCVNPAHLKLGTTQDNIMDMVQRGRQNNQLKTHCPQGHEYTPENIVSRGNARECRKCKYEQNNRRYALKRSQAQGHSFLPA